MDIKSVTVRKKYAAMYMYVQRVLLYVLVGGQRLEYLTDVSNNEEV